VEYLIALIIQGWMSVRQHYIRRGLHPPVVGFYVLPGDHAGDAFHIYGDIDFHCWRSTPDGAYGFALPLDYMHF